MRISLDRSVYAVWLILIIGFAVLHAFNLQADFPNHTPWAFDYAKYTDEGWWGNAAADAHMTGNWYPPLDYNPAPAVPVLPFMEWVLFFFTGVSILAARGLAISFFFANLVLSYLLLRSRGPRWMPFLGLSLLVTSPFLYSFSRLAVLEPLLMTWTLSALNLAVRLPRSRRPVWTSAAIGVLFTLMVLTKSSAVFLLPALGWAMLMSLRKNRRLALRCALAASGTSAITFGLWITVVVSTGRLGDFNRFFTLNAFGRPNQSYWPLRILHGISLIAWKVDCILIPLAFLVVLGAAWAWRSAWSRGLLLDPVFGSSVWAVAGYILFMIYHYAAPPRYFPVVVIFCFLVVAQGTGALFSRTSAAQKPSSEVSKTRRTDFDMTRNSMTRFAGWSVIGVTALAVGINGTMTLKYASHPEYTFQNAARHITEFMDEHPNGKRLLVSVSGDEIALFSNLSTLCEPAASPCHSIPDLASNLAIYQPGWYATWNIAEPTTLEAIHTHFSVEQVASFYAFDNPERNVLVLFKLHPLAAGQVRDPATQNLKVALPDDKIEIPIVPVG